MRWGACLPITTSSDHWSQEEARGSINAREPLVVECGLRHFHLSVAISTGVIFSDNLTAFVYLRKRVRSFFRFSTPCAEDSPLSGGDRLSPTPSVHPGQEQCSGGGLPVSPKQVQRPWVPDLLDLLFDFNGLNFLGPFVAAGVRMD